VEKSWKSNASRVSIRNSELHTPVKLETWYAHVPLTPERKLYRWGRVLVYWQNVPLGLCGVYMAWHDAIAVADHIVTSRSFKVL
jgi:hypothetical protein